MDQCKIVSCVMGAEEPLEIHIQISHGTPSPIKDPSGSTLSAVIGRPLLGGSLPLASSKDCRRDPLPFQRLPLINH